MWGNMKNIIMIINKLQMNKVLALNNTQQFDMPFKIKQKLWIVMITIKH